MNELVTGHYVAGYITDPRSLSASISWAWCPSAFRTVLSIPRLKVASITVRHRPQAGGLMSCVPQSGSPHAPAFLLSPVASLPRRGSSWAAVGNGTLCVPAVRIPARSLGDKGGERPAPQSRIRAPGRSEPGEGSAEVMIVRNYVLATLPLGDLSEGDE